MSDSWLPKTSARQGPLSVEFSRQEYWSGLSFLSPRYLPDPRIEPVSPTLADGFLTAEAPEKPSWRLQGVKSPDWLSPCEQFPPHTPEYQNAPCPSREAHSLFHFQKTLYQNENQGKEVPSIGKMKKYKWAINTKGKNYHHHSNNLQLHCGGKPATATSLGHPPTCFSPSDNSERQFLHVTAQSRKPRPTGVKFLVQDPCC